MKTVNHSVELFRERKFRITPQRLAILRILENNREHPAADDIYRRVLEEYPSTSFTTVYNTLETLVELGQVREVTIDSKRKHYDPDTCRHHHAICVKCGRIMDVTLPEDESMRSSPSTVGKFSVRDYEVHLHGICSECGEAEEVH